MDLAARWLAQSDPKSPYTLWVRARLLKREGKLEESTEALKKLVEAIPLDRSWQVHDFSVDDTWATRPALYEAYDELIPLILKDGDYTGALAAAIKVENHDYAVNIAEHVLTTDELRKFVDARPNDPTMKNVRWILARRYAREGHWDLALPYYPPDEQTFDGLDLGKTAAQTKAHLEAARDPRQPPRSRAKHYIQLGRLIREYGFYLLFPETSGGGYATDTPNPSRVEADLAARDLQSQQAYPESHYWVKLPANYMWQAAQLLPDNDPLCAQALFLGGSYLKYHNPNEADRFYKAFIRRNPNLEIARQANQMRWFPIHFTDAVAYHPRKPDPWYGRKLYVALALMALAVPATLAIYLWTLRKASQAPTAAAPTDNEHQ
jgi:tetratricopeptide (TPR) repeat protein